MRTSFEHFFSSSCTGIVLFAVALLPGIAPALTWYVDASNLPGPGDGSAGNPYTLMTNALDDLAAENIASGTNGGHVILVAPGAYTNTVVLSSAHSGVQDTNNLIRATGKAVIDMNGGNYGILFTPQGSAARFMIIDGFDITRATRGIYLNSGVGNTGDSIIRNCNIYNCYGGNTGHGIYFYTYRRYDEIQNCNIYGNSGAGIYAYYLQITTIRDCNVVNNGQGGIVEGRLPMALQLYNNNLFGNGYANYRAIGVGEFFTATDINTQANCGSNTVANPGLANLADNWNFTVFYTNSPCLNSASDGGNMGSCTNPTTIATSDKTYYVDQSIGDDTNDGLGDDAAHAWATLSRATAAAIAGDTVIIKPGTYAEQMTVTNTGAENMPVRYLAEADMKIDAAGLNYGILLDRVGNVQLRGFTVNSASTDGICLQNSFCCDLDSLSSSLNSQNGIKLQFSASSTMTRCTTYSNTLSGIYFYGSGANTMKAIASYTNNQNGIYCDGCSLRNSCLNSKLHRNRLDGIYLFTYCYAFYLYNSILHGNGNDGIDVHCASAYITNCVISMNGALGVNENYSTGGEICLGNNCLTNANGNFKSKFAPAGTYYTADDINGLFAKNQDNITTNPLFRAEAADDYRLTQQSPCVDTGTTLIPMDTDFCGEPRLVGPAVDMGCIEFPARGAVLTCR